MGRFRRFLEGRYGNDNLNRFIWVVGLVFVVAYTVLYIVLGPLRWLSVIYWAGLLLVIYTLVRAFSRNYPKRSWENQKYLRAKAKVKAFFTPPADAKTHKRFRCPQCRQKVRVPRYKGKLNITCPNCGKKFQRKT